MRNIPQVHIGLVAVSRDCFPRTLSDSRSKQVKAELDKLGVPCVLSSVIVENEIDAKAALAELEKAGVNALVVYLGNFGPETPETWLAQQFPGPVMFTGAAETSMDDMFNGRGDAYCGMLNASYNLGLRGVKAYIAPNPTADFVGTAKNIAGFADIARIVLGVQGLKILSYGPRPNDFLACNAPVKPLYDLGVEVVENSDLDLYCAYSDHKDDTRIADVMADMRKELGDDPVADDLLRRMAQYEVTLLDEVERYRGAAQYVVLANKCWPSFKEMFGFVPCYVNSRFASRLMPIACETDIYGALSEYILVCATGEPATLLDINNTVPADMYKAAQPIMKHYSMSDVFMGFHCGNTPLSMLTKGHIGYQLIQYRLSEEGKEPDITRGTLEGNLRPGDVTIFRLQSTADTQLKSYMAHGEVLPVDCKSFGAIGVIAVDEMERFYRNVLVGQRFPHHSALCYGHTAGKAFEAMRLLGVEDRYFNHPKGMLYPGENPFGV